MVTGSHPHLKLLKKSQSTHQSVDGTSINVFELVLNSAGQAVLSQWARHFREQYCLDSQIDLLRDGTGMSRRDFLTELIFPSASTKLGPAVRSGDFAEILVTDIIEDLYGFWVPRTRYSNKSVTDESPKGSDIIGLKLVRTVSDWDPEDILFIGESKAQMSGRTASPRLQDAVNDSVKDALRKSESLNAAKRKLLLENRIDDAKLIQRFQDPLGRPHKEIFGASAIFCTALFDEHLVQQTDCSVHPSRENLMLIVIHAAELMKFVHSLYERAANEAE